MIVRPLKEQVQVVQQTDHDDLSGEFAAALDGHLWQLRARSSVVRACAEHDEGWRIWERDPDLDPATGGACDFLDVDVRRHLEFYRAGIQEAVDNDPYAGLLVSLHGTGIYRGRHGLDPGLGFRRLDGGDAAPIGSFIAEQEALQSRLAAELAVDPLEVWGAYRLLEVADRFSLYFCRPRSGGAVALGPLAGRAGEDVAIRLEPRGDWTVTLRPNPFGREVALNLRRRLLPDRRWSSPAEFQRALRATPAETVTVTVTA